MRRRSETYKSSPWFQYHGARRPVNLFTDTQSFWLDALRLKWEILELRKPFGIRLLENKVSIFSKQGSVSDKHLNDNTGFLDNVIQSDKLPVLVSFLILLSPK